MAQNSSCKDCTADISEMELHAEIEHLKRHLAERDSHIEAMESEFLKGNTRISELEDQVVTWREKYDRLYDSHRRVQRLNQNLEEKLLQMVDKCTKDKSQLARDVETLSVRLAESNHTIGHLHKENERYKNDMNLAIQLLQCKPDNFVSQKFDSLPPETQTRVSSYIMNKAKLNQDISQVNNMNPSGKNTPLITEKVNPDDFEFNISASLMSKILEESVQNTISNHCDTCTCLKKSLDPFSFGETKSSISTQTSFKFDNLAFSCPHCNFDTNSIKPLVKCNSPLLNNFEELELIQINDKEVNSTCGHFSMNINPVNDNINLKVVESNSNHLKSKPIDENLKMINFKHREIKASDENKDRYVMPSLEPMTVHHRLCDRTKPTTNFNIYNERRHELDIDFVNKNKSPLDESPAVKSHKSNIPDMSFSQIENAVLVPNIVAESKTEDSKSKTDFNSQRLFHRGSISSNDTESKTSSNKSYKNSGSNPKVQIGPGPRFCSLIMQAGSKNILLDNAQPNIAPILYTRQSKNTENTLPLTFNNDMDIGVKHSSHGFDFNYTESHLNEKAHIVNNSNLLDNVDNILDLPNEDLLIRDPMDLSEKPESGYKSNESAEIIDKLLFGPDNATQQKLEPAIPAEQLYKESDLKKDILIQHDQANGKSVNIDENSKSTQAPLECSFSDKMKNETMKVFNFDSYEKNLKQLNTSKKVDMPSELLNTSNTDIKNFEDSQTLINDKTELYNTNIDLKIASKNLSEINKKFNISNKVLPESSVVENKKTDWKKETSTEKSSSSLSSDDSAAVLQKQQLIRVAEWVQKNLEMEQQTDFENSDSFHQSMEEMHHVRNDFPRPAKVDHRIRKNNLKAGGYKSHHVSKHVNVKSVDMADNEKLELNSESRLVNSVNVEKSKSSIDNVTLVSKDDDRNINSSKSHMHNKAVSDVEKYPSECTDSNKSSTTKVYSKQELARMEYNVKQFLLNGTRWTKGPNEECYSKSRRTSSKTETDL